MNVMNLSDFKKKREYSQYLKSLDNYQLGIEVDSIISNAALKLKIENQTNDHFVSEPISSQNHQQSRAQLFSKAKLLLNEISSRLSGPAKLQLEKIVHETFDMDLND